MELNINGIMDTAYSYGNERLTNERFTGWTGYYTYDPRGSVTGVTGSDGYIWQSYRYNAFGDITFGKPQYNNVYSYNAESFNPNMDAQYLRARYYSVKTAGFISEDSYLGDITDPLTLNRYNYVKGSPLNYMDPSGHSGLDIFTPPSKYVHTGDIPVANDSNASYDITKKANTEAACSIINSYINDNQGAFMGGTAGVALVVLTAPASAPVLAVIGAGMAGGAVGMVIGGVLEKGISSADIARTLKTKYNIDVTERQNLDLDSLPSEVKDLCSQYDKNFEDMEGYFETGSVLMGLGMAFYEAGYFLDSLQASIAEKSKKAYESLKSWFNKTFKGESGAGESGSKGKWWHEGYVDNLSDTQILLGVKQSNKGLSTLGSSTRETAMSAGKAWVGDNYNIIKDGTGNVLGYSSTDGMRAFRIQYKPKEGMWRANFQENIMVNNPYPNPGQHSSQLKNVHIDILD